MALGTIDERTRERRFRPAPTRRRSYTEMEKAIALEMLEANDGNLLRTANELGLSVATLHDWQRLQREPSTRLECVEQVRPYVREALADKLEELAHRTVDSITDDVIEAASLQQRVTSAAIAVDKMRLLREQATSIVGNEQLTDADRVQRLRTLIEEASRQPALEAGEQSTAAAEHPAEEQQTASAAVNQAAEEQSTGNNQL